jgi:hypothetical protein
MMNARQQQRFAVVLATAIATGLLGFMARAEEVAYFQIEMVDPTDAFVIKLTESDKIAQARAIAAGSEKRRIHVMGTVIKKPEGYNKQWKFYLDPASITFFETAIEVCDATTSYVEKNLSEVGGAFLPNSHWCPWHSKVVNEVSGHRTTD